MRKKYRKLNPGEAYACSLKDVKAYFGEEPDDVLIDFGSTRHYIPDSQDKERIRPGGSVVARMSVNCRDRNSIGATPVQPTFFLSFYIIKLPYPPEVGKQFVDSCIPAMYDWYIRQRKRPATALSGVEIMLVALDGKAFHLCEYRYRCDWRRQQNMLNSGGSLVKRNLLLAVVLLALALSGCGAENGGVTDDGAQAGIEGSEASGGEPLENEAPAGERAEIVAVVSRNCNYVYHMLAVSGCGYENAYGERYRALHPEADLDILKHNQQLLSVSGGEYQGDLYFLCVVLPASLDDDIAVEEYFEALADLFATGELERNYGAYEGIYRQTFSAYTDVSLESFREFYSGNEGLKEELAQICGVMRDNYRIYLDEAWESTLAELAAVADELNREFAGQDYVCKWEEALDCKYGQEAFYALLTNSMENGPNCIDLTGDKDVFYPTGDSASTARLISHEFGIFLLMDLLADTGAFQSYDYYALTEALAEYYNTVVSGGHNDWDWGAEYIAFYARLREEEPGITARELFLRAEEEYRPELA